MMTFDADRPGAIAASCYVWSIVAMGFEDPLKVVGHEPGFDTDLLMTGDVDPSQPRRGDVQAASVICGAPLDGRGTVSPTRIVTPRGSPGRCAHSTSRAGFRQRQRGSELRMGKEGSGEASERR